MRTLIERLVKSGNAYVAEDHVLFSRAVDARLRPAVERPLDEMIAGARVEVAPYKKRPAGFRAVEAVEARRAGLAVARRHQGAGPARLAHRMLGDVVEISRRDVRHPRRRHRPGLSASRERDRAIALRLPYAGDGELLDAQRLRQVEGEKMSKSLGNFVTIHEAAEGLAGRGRSRLTMLHDALSPADRLDRVTGLQKREGQLGSVGTAAVSGCGRSCRKQIADALEAAPYEALCDDLNAHRCTCACLART